MTSKSLKKETVSFEPAQVFSWVELGVVVVIIVLCAFVYASTLASFLFGLGFFALFIGLYYISLILRRRVIFKDAYFSSIQIDYRQQKLILGDKSYPLAYVKSGKTWSARGVSRIAEIQIKKPKKSIKIATPEAAKLVTTLANHKSK
jgi:hypothetical protein